MEEQSRREFMESMREKSEINKALASKGNVSQSHMSQAK